MQNIYLLGKKYEISSFFIPFQSYFFPNMLFVLSAILIIVLVCGHPCRSLCYEPCDAECRFIGHLDLNCGHKAGGFVAISNQ